MDNVEIQVLDISNNWRTYNIVTNTNPAMIRSAMEGLRWQFPERRIRAVDNNGRLIDIL